MTPSACGTASIARSSSGPRKPITLVLFRVRHYHNGGNSRPLDRHSTRNTALQRGRHRVLHQGRGERPRVFLERRRGRAALRAVRARALTERIRDLPFGSGDYVSAPKGHALPIRPREPGTTCSSSSAAAALGYRKAIATSSGSSDGRALSRIATFVVLRFQGPLDEQIRDVVVKRHGAYHGFRYPHSPGRRGLGRNGLPVGVPISPSARVGVASAADAFTGRFAARGVLVSSFVPRTARFPSGRRPLSVPHSSVDVGRSDLYVSGEFSSRSGVGVGSITLHPREFRTARIPARYEGESGTRRTEEVAVMLDCENRSARRRKHGTWKTPVTTRASDRSSLSSACASCVIRISLTAFVRHEPRLSHVTLGLRETARDGNTRPPSTPRSRLRRSQRLQAHHRHRANAFAAVSVSPTSSAR